MSSYSMTFQPLAFMKGVAALTILSMILSAFPAAFFVAFAEEPAPVVEASTETLAQPAGDEAANDTNGTENQPVDGTLVMRHQQITMNRRPPPMKGWTNQGSCNL